MCLYPKLTKNKYYLPTKKNNYNPPPIDDIRKMYVAIGCGNCIECRKQKAREWQIRLSEEIKRYKYKYFVTLTFSEDELNKITEEAGIKEANYIATLAVRRFLERYRKKYKISLRHWLITELGHEGTERIHLHGIILKNENITNEELQEIWKYGLTDNGKYVNRKTINYITKYVTKIDNDHKGYIPKILCSAGIGSNYITENNIKLHRYRPNNTNETYRFESGEKANLPIYYRNKFYTEEEKGKLWVEKLNQNKTYVRGIEIRNLNTDKGINQYMSVLEEQRKENIKLGYGDNSENWQKKQYMATVRFLNKQQQLQTEYSKKCRKLDKTYKKLEKICKRVIKVVSLHRQSEKGTLNKLNKQKKQNYEKIY